MDDWRVIAPLISQALTLSPPCMFRACAVVMSRAGAITTRLASVSERQPVDGDEVS